MSLLKFFEWFTARMPLAEWGRQCVLTKLSKTLIFFPRTLQASTTKKISVALQCATMNKILEPKSAFSVSPVSRTNSYFDKEKTLDMTRPSSTHLIPSRYFISYPLIKASDKAWEREARARPSIPARPIVPSFPLPTLSRVIKPYWRHDCSKTTMRS